MQNDSINFLRQLSDKELAFFKKYRLPNLNKNSGEEITEFLAKKEAWETPPHLLENTLTIDSMNKDDIRCPRCDSAKIIVSKYKQSCLVCEYSTYRNRLLKSLNYILQFI